MKRSQQEHQKSDEEGYNGSENKKIKKCWRKRKENEKILTRKYFHIKKISRSSGAE